MKIFWYFLHNIISKIGNKITSIAILFILISSFSKNSLSISILLFSIDPIINILFSRLYSKIISRYQKFGILVFLDFISAIFIFLVFLFSKNILLMFIFYILLSIVVNLSSRYSKGLFFNLTKNTIKEEWYYKINSRINTILSIVAPSISSFIIAKIGNENAFILDGVSFMIGGIIYLLILDKLKEITQSKVKESISEKSVNVRSKEEYKFMYMLSKCSNDFKFICTLFIAVSFITNFEEPLIFNYLSLERSFSKELIGISLSIFSVGMFLGSFIYDYIPKNTLGLFACVVLDGFFSFFLSINIYRWLIVFFYMLQGIMATVIMIYFSVSIQKEFETNDLFMQFDNQLNKVLSFFSLASYFCGFLLSNIISDSSIFLKILAILEILTAIFYLYRWKVINK